MSEPTTKNIIDGGFFTNTIDYRQERQVATQERRRWESLQLQDASTSTVAIPNIN
jgi:hypothetical protein